MVFNSMPSFFEIFPKVFPWVFSKIFWIFLLALGLSACGSAARVNKLATAPKIETSAAQEKVVIAVPAGQEAGKSVSKPVIAVETKSKELASLTYGSAPLQPKIDDDPKKLLGMDTQKLIALLGDPSLVRRENPAEIWQYSTTSCVLDLFFYDAVTTYVEARDTQVRPMDKRVCLRSLLLSRQ